MSTRKNRSFQRMRLVVCIFAVALALLAALVGVMGARHTSAPSPGVMKTVLPSAVPQRTRPIADFESELVTITSHGFEPTEIVRPQGAFQLAIEDRSGLETLSLLLSPSVGPHLSNIRSLRTEPNWNQVVDLEPGEYVLTAVQNPRWHCHLIITGR